MKKFTNVHTIVGFKMYRNTAILIVLVGSLQSSCKSQKTSVLQETQNDTMELVLQDDYSGMVEEGILVIKDEKSLKRFFSKINRTRKPALEIPAVDFTREMLVVWCPGETQNPDQGLQFKNETTDVYTLERINPSTNVKQSAIISPFMVYKFPLSNKRVVVE